MINEWISTKIAVPPYSEHVFVCYKHNNRFQVKVGQRRSSDRSGDHWDIFGINSGANMGGESVSYWMPLPVPPVIHEETNAKNIEI